MPFTAGLRQSLFIRDCQLASEFVRGDTLEDVLERHLRAVEEMAETELLTSILLLSSDGRRLSHGAAPNLPKAYRDAIDGASIGPNAGSCGTAAYLGRPIYVSDIASDPLWADYRDIALPHGLRSCWSTPIRATDGSVIGTFAIYHRQTGHPTSDELEAIEMITDHVAQAILWARAHEHLEESDEACRWPRLRLVADNPPVEDAATESLERLLLKAERLEALSAQLHDEASRQEPGECQTEMHAIAKVGTNLASIIRNHIERFR